MEQQCLRESQHRERERQEQRIRDRREGRGDATMSDDDDEEASTSVMNASMTGLLLAQGTSHYKTMALQVTSFTISF